MNAEQTPVGAVSESPPVAGSAAWQQREMTRMHDLISEWTLDVIEAPPTPAVYHAVTTLVEVLWHHGFQTPPNTGADRP